MGYRGEGLCVGALFRGTLVADFLSAARSNSGSFRPPGSRTLHTPPEQGAHAQAFADKPSSAPVP